MLRIYRAPDYESMSARAAEVMAARVLLNPRAVIGLATGSTPLGLYAGLAKKNAAGEISFREVHTVNLDEYLGLTPDHPQSYRYFMNKNLFSNIDIPAENTNVPNGAAADPAAECARYNALIESLGGIDMQLLGIGHDGHIGFNEPGESFVPGTNCVALAEKTIEANSRFFDSADEVPKFALTMGIRAIMQAKEILVVVNGADKAEILEQSFFGPMTPAVPASILQLHPNVILCADDAALAAIREKHPGVIE